MASKDGDAAAPRRDFNSLLLFLLVSTSGGGLVLGGAGNSRVADKLDQLGKAVENATHELVELRHTQQEDKAVADRRMTEMELRMQQIERAMRKDAFAKP